MLAISTAQTFASNWLAPRLGGFQIARPELAVRLLTSNAMTDFASDDVDVAVRMGKGPWPGLRQHFLFCLYATPVCTPEFRDRHRIDRPEDLLRVARLNAHDWWWKHWLEAAGVALADETRQQGIRHQS